MSSARQGARVSGPTVSVVTPVRDGVRWIGDAIASVLAQTYEVLGHVVVDDGSSDRTAEVAAAQGERVKVLTIPASGVASARNVGMREAGGDLVAFLDADDIWAPRKIERQVAAWEAAGGPGLVLSGYEIVDDGGRRLGACLHKDFDAVLRGWVSLEGNGPLLSSTGMSPLPVATAVGTAAR